MEQISIVVVAESVLDRDALRVALEDVADVKLLALAQTGKNGLARLQQHHPQLMLLSVDLEDMSAAEVTRQALALEPDVGVLLMAAHRRPDVAEAMEAGALELLVLPQQGEQGREEVIRRRLLPKVRSISSVLYSRQAKRTTGVEQPAMVVSPAAPRKRPTLEVDVVLIGVSTGGSEALARLVPRLPAGLPVPVVIVLHMPERFTGSLAEDLDLKSALSVRAAHEGDVLRPGVVYLAPGGRHLEMERGTCRRLILHVTDTPAECGCKPSANVLFRTAAAACPGGALALIMTGMGDDGVEGLTALKQRPRIKVRVLAQDEATSVVWGMPGSAVRAGLVDEVLPLQRLAQRIEELVGAK